jgi:hypothetical protein
VKTLWGRHTRKYYGYPDPTNDRIPKEIKMSDRRKTVLMRALRTAGATFIGFLAAWLAGPEAADLVESEQAQTLIAMVVVPTLVALDKMLRYGSDAGESVE